MGTMAERPDERLIEFLATELDAGLEGVFRYDSDGVERLWPSGPRVGSATDQATVERGVRVVEQLVDSAPDGRPPGRRPATEGVVWLTEERMLVVLPGAAASGHVVTIDREAEMPESAFVEACLAAMW